ncbi:hypothetical protein CALVIDRAFT_562685 [Calocera viscosa TUFC12733]|uniref:Uncharacterized protein n=1 Tax=Calocera viscosa (strain TUFC12733) TaxID=1330018 RepID=A0A167NJM9_CALVF|nr:hypothetical protein CALVIDRAFT_562685 [Calocera viscosa TUFC12733]
MACRLPMTTEYKQKAKDDDIGSACAGPPGVILADKRNNEALDILGAADNLSGVHGFEGERPGIAWSQNNELAVPIDPIRAKGGDSEATKSTAASARAPEVVGQYDFNKLSDDCLRIAAPSTADIRLRDDSDAVLTIRLRDGPDADTAPTQVATSSASAPEEVMQHDLNKLPTDSNDSLPHSTDAPIARTQRALDDAESMYRSLVPDSPVHAVEIECRLASIAILRRAVQIQADEENGTAPPPYDPAWRAASNPTISSIAASEPYLSTSRPSSTSPPTPPKPHQHNFTYDARVYSDPAALRAYRQARNADFERYRQAHGLTTIRGRISNWWKNFYGGLSYDELTD